MGSRRMFDEDVNEVFSVQGVAVAIYFEALRYKQQMTPDSFFPFCRDKISKKTDLTFKQQARARRVLIASGWIEAKRGFNRGGGTITLFRVTHFAKNLIKDTPRRRNIYALRNKLLPVFSTAKVA